MHLPKKRITMRYWQAVCNEFYNRHARDYNFKYTTLRYYPEEEELEKTLLKRHKYYFDKENNLYLTEREAGCIFHMCLGLTIKETATELLLSPRSVEFYLKRIKTKFAIQYKKQLLHYFKSHPYYEEFYALMDEEFNT